MAKKVWTPAARKAFAAKIAKAAGRLAWRGAKLTGRVGRESAKAAAREVKASICRPRATNPHRRRRRRNPPKRFAVQVMIGGAWQHQATFTALADAKLFARVYAGRHRRNAVRVVRSG